MKINKPFLKIVAPVICIAIFLSCKKTVTPDEIGITKGQTIVKILTSNPFADTVGTTDRPDYFPIVLSVSPTPTLIEFVDIRRDAATPADLNTALTVKLKDDPGVLSTIDPAIQSIPESAFIVDPSNPRVGDEYTVTFAPGEFAKTLKIRVNTSLIDLSHRNGLGFTITSISGVGKISSNYFSRGVEITLNNQYDGIYLLRGYILRAGDASATGWVGPKEITLATNGPSSVRYVQSHGWANQATIGIAGSVSNPTYTVAPDNSVTITSDGGAFPAGLGNLAPFNSRYDPATKTFYAYATWSGGAGNREMKDTLVYLRPR